MMKVRQSSGVRKIATRKDTDRATATVMGRARMNSPELPEMMIKGRKEAMMVRVAVRTGTRTSEGAFQAASRRGTLWSRSST